MDVYSLAAVLEGVLEEHREEYAEERRHKDAALFYPAANRKGLGGGAVEAYCADSACCRGMMSPQQAGVGGSRSSGGV